MAAAETFSVNTGADGSLGAVPPPCGGGTECTLRQAIELSNENGSAERDKIIFAIGGPSRSLVIEATPLPAITTPLTIDGKPFGSTEEAPTLELVPITGAQAGSGLTVVGASGVRIEDLSIGGFATGIEVAPEEGEAPVGTEICGDYIGVEVEGVSTHPNGAGIEVRPAPPGEQPERTTIGNGGSCAGNVIGGNTEYGIVDSGLETTIAGNRIGIGPAPDDDFFPNGSVGAEAAAVLETASAVGALIGVKGQGAPGANLIEGNVAPGVRVEGSAGEISIRHNSITGNEGLGIEIVGGTQAAPTISSAETNTAGTLEVKGTVTGTTDGETVELEFFGNPVCDPSGSGEGQTNLYSMEMAVEEGSNPYTFILPVEPPLDDTAITATSTREAGGTTEFSECATYAKPPQTYVVNTREDRAGGGCLSTCSLREAIEAADQTTAADTIDFAEAAEGVIGIEGFPLPTITEPLEIDGTSAPGYAGEPVVMIDGTNSSNEGPTTGLEAQDGGTTTIKGLAIGGFGNGVVLDTAPGSRLCASWIGVELDGTTALPNGTGVEIESDSQDAVIGGGASCGGNVISGNSEDGVFDGGVHTVIEANLIGTDVAGTGPLPNGTGGEEGAGVVVGAAASESRVGQDLSEAPVGAGNTIAFNDGPGVLVESGAVGTSIRRSSIYANEGEAIEFQTPSSVPAPQLESFAAGPTETSYTVPFRGGLADEAYEVDLFANARCGAFGIGPAEVLLGSGELTTDGGGEGEVVIHGGPLTSIDAESFTATATEVSTGTTSQLSVCEVTPPETEIGTKPAAVAKSPDPTFTFSGTDFGEVAGFECSLDAAAFETCATPKEYAGLADGSHTFSVRAVDAEGFADPTPATYEWTVDTAPPAAPVLTATEPASPANDTTPVLRGTAEAGTTVTLYANASCTAPAIGTVGAAELEEGIEENVAADTTTTFSATAGLEGTTSACSAPLSYLEDSTDPTVTIEEGPDDPTDQTTAVLKFSGEDPGGSGIAGYECSMDVEDVYAPCTSPATYTGLAAGTHDFEVVAIDDAGNASAPVQFIWTVDTEPPTVTITAGPSGSTNATAAALEFTDTDSSPIASLECRLDSAPFSTCASPQNYTGLLDGPHTFEVKATDEAGNTSTPVSRTWTVNTAAPTVTITVGPSGTVDASAAGFEFTATETGAPVTAVECSLDGAAFATCESPRNYAGLADGPHTFEVKATDADGNVGGPVVRTWTIDTVAPTPAITAKPPATTEATAATFEFGAGPEATAYECSLDAGAFEACSSPQSFKGLAPGPHTFAVRAGDEAGNRSAPQAYEWTVAAPPAQQTQATPPPPAAEGPTPANGEKVVVAPVEGKILVKLPGTSKFVDLEELKEIPVGAVIDATGGKVRLTSIDPDGTEQTAAFFGGVFKVKQREGSGLVVLELLDTDACTASTAKDVRRRGGTFALASAAHPGSGTSGKLWGSGHGNFRTEGNNGSATVRGTIWLVEDRCDGTTFFRTRRGIVSVHDFTTGKTFPLPAGNRYVAGE